MSKTLYAFYMLLVISFISAISVAVIRYSKENNVNEQIASIQKELAANQAMIATLIQATARCNNGK